MSGEQPVAGHDVYAWMVYESIELGTCVYMFRYELAAAGAVTQKYHIHV